MAFDWLHLLWRHFRCSNLIGSPNKAFSILILPIPCTHIDCNQSVSRWVGGWVGRSVSQSVSQKASQLVSLAYLEIKRQRSPLPPTPPPPP